MDFFAKGTAAVILFVIIAFAILAAWYLTANNFAKETLEVVFPAFGAILVSCYLGFKGIAIDRPPPKTFGFTVAILHDMEHGNVSSMVPFRLVRFRSLELIDHLHSYIPFKNVPIRSALHSASNSPEPANEEMIDNIVEWALIKWLADPVHAPGTMESPPIILINGGGGGSQFAKDLKGVPVISPHNPLLLAEPATVEMPLGTTICCVAKPCRKIFITTKHSRITFQIHHSAWQKLGQPPNSQSEKLYKALGLPPNPKALGIFGFGVEVEAEQFPFSRYSDQAKIELEWLNVLERKLDADFSWDRLRAELLMPEE